MLSLHTLRDGLLSISYPQDCRICGDAIQSWDDGVACFRCWNDPAITRLFLDTPTCAKCGTPLRDQKALPRFIEDYHDRQRQTSLEAAGSGKRACGNCEAFPFFSARACGEYSGALQANIIFMKSRPHLCKRLRSILIRTFFDSRAKLDSQIVMPVPLHRSRERERGFNQAMILAKAIADAFHLRIDAHSLIRTKNTERHRAGIDRVSRARSVERAFEVARPRLVEQSRVLLIDDVLTTGSTICAASNALLEAGAERVNVLTVARAADAPARSPGNLRRSENRSATIANLSRRS